MSAIRAAALAERAEGLLPPLPGVIEFLADAGGVLRLEVLERTGRGLRARADRSCACARTCSCAPA